MAKVSTKTMSVVDYLTYLQDLITKVEKNSLDVMDARRQAEYVNEQVVATWGTEVISTNINKLFTPDFIQDKKSFQLPSAEVPSILTKLTPAVPQAEVAAEVVVDSGIMFDPDF